jgi:hypothetical protein
VFVEISREVNGKGKCHERTVENLSIRYDICGKLAGWQNYTGILSGLPPFWDFSDANISKPGC